MFGILKGGKVQLNSIVKNLQNGEKLKKGAIRLGNRLGEENLWLELSDSLLETQKHYLKQVKFMILDLSDIQKKYAIKMEGLSRVRDGSTGDIGLGYWLCNVAGINESGKLIVPCYSELYSHEIGTDSENTKILNAIQCCSKIVGTDKIWVIDRGADRSILIESLLESKQHFIIRQVGNRDLYFEGEKLPLKEISKRVKLTESYTVEKTKNNKKVKETYDCGAVKVRLTKTGKDLWLVVEKECNKGYCWLLCYLDCENKKEAIKTAFVGYGHRWKIEEVHRQIKTDYELESICIQRYSALKSMNVLLWAVASFLYTRLESLSEEIVFHRELALVNRSNLSDLLRFIYYKLAFAVKKLLNLSKLHGKSHRIRSVKQAFALN